MSTWVSNARTSSCSTPAALIHAGREGLNEFKKAYAQAEDKGSLADCMVGADMFLGLSVKDAISQDMVKTMAKNAIIFACANPDPEIPYPGPSRKCAPTSSWARARSDFPNQVNNVLGFPFIFRGALDSRATTINEEMKIAAAEALAKLAKEPVAQEICDAYGVGQAGIRHRLHHSQAARPARADLAGTGRGQGRHGHRRGQNPARPGSIRQGSRSPG